MSSSPSTENQVADDSRRAVVNPGHRNEQAYPYRPLEGTDIRYITLQPFDKDVGLVECTVWQKPLEETEFNAISYAWGDSAITEPILVAGQLFQVTTNLAACLKRLATSLTHDPEGPDETPRSSNLLKRQATGLVPDPKHPEDISWASNIWVDAICINQRDLAERNAQVLRMKDIFPKARMLYVWLGEERPNTGLAVDRMNELSRFLDREKDDQYTTGDMKAELVEHIYSLNADSEHEKAVRAEVQDIYSRDWWQRTWILQEVGFAREVTVLVGSYNMTWLAIGSVLKLAGFLMVDNPDALFSLNGPHMMDPSSLPFSVLTLRDDMADNFESRLQSILDSTKGAEATDPRDKVYGVLGLGSDFRSGEIVPRYELSVQEVFSDVVKAHFKKYDDLDILAQCFFTATSAAGFPSWLPNWDAHQKVTAEPIDKYVTDDVEEPQPTFAACGGLPLSSSPWSFGDDDTSLHLTGACFDTILSVTEMADFLNGWTLESTLKDWLPAIGEPDAQYGFSSETRLQAFRKTVVTDMGFAPTARGFSMVFPDDEDAAEIGVHPKHNGDSDKSYFLSRLMQARPPFYKACMCKRVATSSKGMIGLVRQEVQPGDRVAVLVGSKVPQCLREIPDSDSAGSGIRAAGKNRYQLIGEAYFHGVMDGEAMTGLELEEIVLV